VIRLDDLLTNLFSEAIGILVTVVGVDRVIAWHEKRKWREVREIFLSQANRACNRVLEAWGIWLQVLAAEAPKELGDFEKTALMETGFLPGHRKGSLSLVEIALGKPVGAQVNRFLVSAGSADVKALVAALGPFVTERLPLPDQDAWRQLGTALDEPVSKLGELVGKYSTLVDPQLALAVIRLSAEVENLHAGVYPARQEEPSFALAAAMTLCSALRQSFELKLYIRNHSE